ncbi:unnamed protein product [Protopolystoma xenopodis]|uniref:Uncharacterized protein n=1 Tax=Protopolystoma xenopodis TaxID=117903 RepID=A0A448WTI7_9PLAT|nr:unnamed protein product [Protopolystoma xenopodis]
MHKNERLKRLYCNKEATHDTKKNDISKKATEVDHVNLLTQKLSKARQEAAELELAHHWVHARLSCIVGQSPSVQASLRHEFSGTPIALNHFAWPLPKNWFLKEAWNSGCPSKLVVFDLDTIKQCKQDDQNQINLNESIILQP